MIRENFCNKEGLENTEFHHVLSINGIRYFLRNYLFTLGWKFCIVMFPLYFNQKIRLNEKISQNK